MSLLLLLAAGGSDPPAEDPTGIDYKQYAANQAAQYQRLFAVPQYQRTVFKSYARTSFSSYIQTESREV